MQQSKTLDYVFQKTIGEGTFAKVKLAMHTPTKQLVAIKILNKTKITDNSDIQRVHREMHILKLVRHPNVIQLYETIQITKQLFFVMEYCENGQLFKYIVDQGKLKEPQACRLFEQLISGLEYLHKLHISHRDLKTQNLLLDHNMNLKIVDFGLANTYTKEQTLRTPCGSQVYAAPEILQGQKYNGDMVDIWSSGIILFAMVCGHLPFQDQNPVQLTKKILHGKYNLSSSVSSQLKDLLQKILTKNPAKRYTIQKIRSHPWMNKHLTMNSNRNKGIIVGYNRIPIDPLILKQMGKQHNPQYVSKCLQANRHNKQTTTYYLMMKKYIRQGGNSICDLSNIHFHPNPLKQISKSKEKIKKQISILEQNKQNIPFNNQKIQVQFNRKSLSKKTSLKINLNQSKIQGSFFVKDSSSTTTHKLIKPSRLSRLNESIVSKGSKKQIPIQKSKRQSIQKIPLTKYVSTKLEKRPKKSQSQQKNKSVIINQTFIQHKRQKSTGQIKKKLNESIVNRPSLNPKKKKVL